ncbi:SDR family oxidoreductase [uncultured Croceitalea sp.]|uniref:SDR family oxidoreductase n=1 Tax=uncultured Croceitalea sp. TaxID=1798908 RepID=UPI0033058C69
MSRTVGVMGCGWLGLPLAEKLLKSGYKVRGTTTSTSKVEQLELAGIKGFKIQLHENAIAGDITNFLSGLDTLIINVPPGLRGNSGSNYVSKINLLLNEIQKAAVKNIVFVSSTSVYGSAEGEITEDTILRPETESGKQLAQSEALFQKENNLNTAIVRFGGLIGRDRHPVNHLAGKKGLKNGDALVNLIHLEDCIQMLITIVQKRYWRTIFNGVYPLHPTKRAYYTNEALKRGLPPPEFESSSSKRNKKLIISKNYLIKLNALYTSIIS